MRTGRLLGKFKKTKIIDHPPWLDPVVSILASAFSAAAAWASYDPDDVVFVDEVVGHHASMLDCALDLDVERVSWVPVDSEMLTSGTLSPYQ